MAWKALKSSRCEKRRKIENCLLRENYRIYSRHSTCPVSGIDFSEISEEREDYYRQRSLCLTWVRCWQRETNQGKQVNAILLRMIHSGATITKEEAIEKMTRFIESQMEEIAFDRVGQTEKAIARTDYSSSIHIIESYGIVE
ncbi:hypothetical protein LguiB_032231 [Lonicera macranthoides]